MKGPFVRIEVDTDVYIYTYAQRIHICSIQITPDCFWVSAMTGVPPT